MNAPQSHNFQPSLCVNKEMVMFNRKMEKSMQGPHISHSKTINKNSELTQNLKTENW